MCLWLLFFALIMVVNDSSWGINATKIMKIMLPLSEKMIFFGSNHKGGYLLTIFPPQRYTLIIIRVQEKQKKFSVGLMREIVAMESS